MLLQIFVSSTLWWRDMQKVPRSMVQWPGTREWLPCTRYLVQCTRYLVQCTKYLEQSTKYLVHSVPGNIWQVFGTECTSYTPQASLLPPSLPPPPPDKVLGGTACPVWFSKRFCASHTWSNLCQSRKTLKSTHSFKNQIYALTSDWSSVLLKRMFFFVVWKLTVSVNPISIHSTTMVHSLKHCIVKLIFFCQTKITQGKVKRIELIS